MWLLQLGRRAGGEASKLSEVLPLCDNVVRSPSDPPSSTPPSPCPEISNATCLCSCLPLPACFPLPLPPPWRLGLVAVCSSSSPTFLLFLPPFSCPPWLPPPLLLFASTFFLALAAFWLTAPSCLCKSKQKKHQKPWFHTTKQMCKHSTRTQQLHTHYYKYTSL